MSEEDPVLVYNSSGLSGDGRVRNAEGKRVPGYYKLMADIDFTGVTWNPRRFYGILDGNGRTIKGLRVTSNTGDGTTYQDCNHYGQDAASVTGTTRAYGYGLFAILAKGAAVRNLTFEDVDIDVLITEGKSYGDTLAHHYAGTIAGVNFGSIENCKIISGRVHLDLNGDKERDCNGVGGIAGINAKFVTHAFLQSSNAADIYYGRIKGCVNKADVKISNTNGEYGEMYAGGIASRSSRLGYYWNNNASTNKSYNTQITNCANFGTVTKEAGAADMYIFGGIVGEADGGFELSGCFNAGKVEFPETRVFPSNMLCGNPVGGGIIGRTGFQDDAIYVSDFERTVASCVTTYEPTADWNRLSVTGPIVGMSLDTEISDCRWYNSRRTDDNPWHTDGSYSGAGAGYSTSTNNKRMTAHELVYIDTVIKSEKVTQSDEFDYNAGAYKSEYEAVIEVLPYHSGKGLLDESQFSAAGRRLAASIGRDVLVTSSGSEITVKSAGGLSSDTDINISVNMNDKSSSMDTNVKLYAREYVKSNGFSLPSDITLVRTADSQQAELKASIDPPDASDKSVTWSITRGAEYIEITPDGDRATLTAKGNGTAVVTAMANDSGITRNCTVEIVIPVWSLTPQQSGMTVLKGEEVTLAAAAYPDNAMESSLTWYVDTTGTGNSYQQVETETITGGETAEYTLTAESDRTLVKAEAVSTYGGADYKAETVFTITCRTTVSTSIPPSFDPGVYITLPGYSSRQGIAGIIETSGDHKSEARYIDLFVNEAIDADRSLTPDIAGGAISPIPTSGGTYASEKIPVEEAAAALRGYWKADAAPGTQPTPVPNMPVLAYVSAAPDASRLTEEEAANRYLPLQIAASFPKSDLDPSKIYDKNGELIKDAEGKPVTAITKDNLFDFIRLYAYVQTKDGLKAVSINEACFSNGEGGSDLGRYIRVTENDYVWTISVRLLVFDQAGTRRSENGPNAEGPDAGNLWLSAPDTSKLTTDFGEQLYMVLQDGIADGEFRAAIGAAYLGYTPPSVTAMSIALDGVQSEGADTLILYNGANGGTSYDYSLLFGPDDEYTTGGIEWEITEGKDVIDITAHGGSAAVTPRKEGTAKLKAALPNAPDITAEKEIIVKNFGGLTLNPNVSSLSLAADGGTQEINVSLSPADGAYADKIVLSLDGGAAASNVSSSAVSASYSNGVVSITPHSNGVATLAVRWGRAADQSQDKIIRIMVTDDSLSEEDKAIISAIYENQEMLPSGVVTESGGLMSPSTEAATTTAEGAPSDVVSAIKNDAAAALGIHPSGVVVAGAETNGMKIFSSPADAPGTDSYWRVNAVAEFTAEELNASNIGELTKENTVVTLLIDHGNGQWGPITLTGLESPDANGPEPNVYSVEYTESGLKVTVPAIVFDKNIASDEAYVTLFGAARADGTTSPYYMVMDGNPDGTYKFAIAISAEDKGPEPANGVTLDRTILTLEQGESIQLTATVTPANAANKNVTWTSSDETVATVTQDGTVTAVAKEGKATISAVSVQGGYMASCEVTVTDIRVVTQSSSYRYMTNATVYDPGTWPEEIINVSVKNDEANNQAVLKNLLEHGKHDTKQIDGMEHAEPDSVSVLAAFTLSVEHGGAAASGKSIEIDIDLPTAIDIREGYYLYALIAPKTNNEQGEEALPFHSFPCLPSQGTNITSLKFTVDDYAAYFTDNHVYLVESKTAPVIEEPTPDIPPQPDVTPGGDGGGGGCSAGFGTLALLALVPIILKRRK